MIPQRNVAVAPRRAGTIAPALYALVSSLADVPAAWAPANVPIVQARPDTGSRIRRELVRIYIPATRNYDELTPEQKEEFRAQFAGLAELDDPPYPAHGLLPVAEDIARALADGKVGKGALFVTVAIDEQGEPQSTKVYETPDSRVSREAAMVLMTTKYRPGRCAGKPCASEFSFTARFDVE